jgi:glutaryl-CoA dehydrogenase
MDRLQRVNMQFKSATTGGKPKRPKQKPVTDIWASMNLDRFLSAKGVEKRKQTNEVMDRCRNRLYKHVEETSFPKWIIDELRPIGINGMDMKGYGSPELSTVEAGAVTYELAKVDGSISTFLLVHNAIGMAVIAGLGDEE